MITLSRGVKIEWESLIIFYYRQRIIVCSGLILFVLFKYIIVSDSWKNSRKNSRKKSHPQFPRKPEIFFLILYDKTFSKHPKSKLEVDHLVGHYISVAIFKPQGLCLNLIFNYKNKYFYIKLISIFWFLILF